jgi:hypothetical protein
MTPTPQEVAAYNRQLIEEFRAGRGARAGGLSCS